MNKIFKITILIFTLSLCLGSESVFSQANTPCIPTPGDTCIVVEGKKLDAGVGVNGSPYPFEHTFPNSAVRHCDTYVNASTKDYFIGTATEAEYLSFRDAAMNNNIPGVTHGPCGCGDGYCDALLEDCGVNGESSGIAHPITGLAQCAFATDGSVECGPCPLTCGDGYCVDDANEHCAPLGSNNLPNCNSDCEECVCEIEDITFGSFDCDAGTNCADCVLCSNCCGNGIIEGTEQCDGAQLGTGDCSDAGKLNPGLACDSNCLLDYSGCVEPGCWSAGSAIPLGETTGSDCVWAVEGSCGVPPTPTPYPCAPGVNEGDSCPTIGARCYFDMVNVDCNWNGNCQYDERLCVPCTPPPCGDGSLDLGELCDGNLLGGVECSDFPGYIGGSLGCDTSCQFDFTNCTPAGINGQCDTAYRQCINGTPHNYNNIPGNYLWDCVGSGGGSTDNCSMPRPTCPDQNYSTNNGCGDVTLPAGNLGADYYSAPCPGGCSGTVFVYCNVAGNWDNLSNTCDTAETCNDGIQNQNETGVDCGGVCSCGCWELGEHHPGLPEQDFCISTGHPSVPTYDADSELSGACDCSGPNDYWKNDGTGATCGTSEFRYRSMRQSCS